MQKIKVTVQAVQELRLKEWKQTDGQTDGRTRPISLLSVLLRSPMTVYYLASVAIAVDSSHMTASSSASWSRFSPPSNFVNGHVSAMWFMVCRLPQSQEGD